MEKNLLGPPPVNIPCYVYESQWIALKHGQTVAMTGEAKDDPKADKTSRLMMAQWIVQLVLTLNSVDQQTALNT